MLTVHHLGKSQSERIIWLCEELEIPYELRHYTRDPVTMLSPPDLKALHPIGSAPVITEGDLVLAESGAIIDYIVAKHGDGRLTLGPDHRDFAAYLYWLHFANGSLQPSMGRNMILRRLNLGDTHPMVQVMRERLGRTLGSIEARLGAVEYLAGSEFTIADIMTVFSLTTMRFFMPVGLSPYPNILAYIQRMAARPAYRRAMANGDPGMELLLT